MKRTQQTWIAAAAFAAAVACFPSGSADAGLFGFGEHTYETFKGKFIDTGDAKTAQSDAQGSITTAKALGESGHSLGALDWDGVQSPGLDAYGNRILQRLLAAWGGQRPPMRLWITADPGLAAESTGNGDLFIARGWFEQVESEDEIAAVMAHEISHVLLNHFARQQGNDDRVRAIASGASIATTAFALASVRGASAGPSGVTVNQDSAAAHNNLRKTLLLKFAIEEFSSYTLNAPWAREQEDQADLLGTDLLYRAKYNTLAMKKMLERLRDYETSAATQVDQITMQYDDSIKNDLAKGDIDALKSAFAEMLGNIALEKGDQIRQRLLRSHPDTQDRLDDITKYLAREYADDPGAQPEKNAFRALLANKEVHGALADHDLSLKANKLVTDGQYVQARAVAQKSAAGGAPYPLRILAQATQQSGDPAHGLDFFRRAAASPQASFATVVLLASQYAGLKRFKEADATLDRAAQRFGSTEATYPARITVALSEGDKPKATAIYTTCMQLKNTDLQENCRVANGDSCTSSQLLCAFKDRGTDVSDFLGKLLKP
jgi:predicted Zn-dependent protease